MVVPASPAGATHYASLTVTANISGYPGALTICANATSPGAILTGIEVDMVGSSVYVTGAVPIASAVPDVEFGGNASACTASFPVAQPGSSGVVVFTVTAFSVGILATLTGECGGTATWVLNGSLIPINGCDVG
jgi:hypothetical protein